MPELTIGPAVALMTGSRMMSPSPTSPRVLNTVLTLSAEGSRPIFTAVGRFCATAQSICRRNSSPGTSMHPLTPCEFWAVTAVTAHTANTRIDAHTRRSACMPAHPPLSVAEMTSTVAGEFELVSLLCITFHFFLCRQWRRDAVYCSCGKGYVTGSLRRHCPHQVVRVCSQPSAWTGTPAVVVAKLHKLPDMRNYSRILRLFDSLFRTITLPPCISMATRPSINSWCFSCLRYWNSMSGREEMALAMPCIMACNI